MKRLTPALPDFYEKPKTKNQKRASILALYLRDFNREYLSTPADRRRTRQTILDYLAALACILLAAAALYLWQP